MNEAYFRGYQAHVAEWFLETQNNLLRPELGVENLSLEAAQGADLSFQLLSLRYTAGEPIEPLRTELEGVVAAYERYAHFRREYEQDPEEPPLYFAEIADFERCMQLIGLCYLLHRRDLIRRIAKFQDPAYAGEDTLYEDLLAFELEGRFDVDEWFHDKPYRDLINALYRESKDEALVELKKYVLAWYPAMSNAPWHDGHSRIEGTDGDYFGYWAFEAGAVAYLLHLDDTSIDHMVYPKDLVRFAREFEQGIEEPAAENARLRCEAGQPCPRAGYWFTPASPNSRRRFVQGELMPDTKSSWGATIWQWDENQS
jgi:hypothetical protein